MVIMENLDEWPQKGAHTTCFSGDLPNAKILADLTQAPMHPPSGHNWNDAGAGWRAGEFYKDISSKAMMEFESLASPFRCERATVLLTERQKSCSILFLLEGAVTIRMNLIDGKRLPLGIAMPGEVLGLAAALSGYPYEITAVALFPCLIASLPRQSFLDFLLRYPVACRNSARLLTAEYERSCEQLRLCEVA
jgi:hypothetical protein